MRAVLLDLDGTLTDSRPGIVASLHAALRALGHEPEPRTDMRFALGPPIDDVMRRLLAPYGDPRVREGVEAYRAAYAAGGMLDNAVYPGIPAALDALRAGGARLFVATSKRVEFACRILEHFALADRMTAIHGAEPGGALDHKPALIAHVLRTHDLDPRDVVMVGDRSYDIEGAHANGVRALGVLWGYGSRAELEHAGADALVVCPDELAEADRRSSEALRARKCCQPPSP